MELIDEISLLADSKINDQFITERLIQIMYDDQYLRNEYIIQKSIKNLLAARISNQKAPFCLSERLKNILNDEITNLNL